ncbi:MAG: MotA/TolQ/ExbB proton channel family protein [Cyclobacteriaceae bacterium]|nr:MotA/TolQ/ExbB proton channel family protein [Cyclobacteriaceae bacterium]
MSISEFHWMGGIEFMSVLSLSLITIVAISVLNITRLSRGKYFPDSQFLVINDIKAIGIFAIIWGIFGQSIGLFSALQAIEAAGDISPAMVYGGLKVSFITTLYGMFIFLLAWLITIGLTNWSRKKKH